MFASIFRNPSIFILPKRFAGHSKWANIKHIKALKDSQRSTLFSRLCQRMKVAIKDGGSANPDNNLQLAQVIEVAKKQNMPLSSIQSCIKSAQADKTNCQSHWFEVKGPSGYFMIIHTLTDNHRKTRDMIAPVLKKHKVLFADRSVRNLFLQKGEIVAIPPSDLKNVEEAVVDHAIECGAEEVFPDESEEGGFKFICEQNMLNIVNSKLQVLKYNVKSADFSFIPSTKVELSDKDMDTLSRLIEKLEELPDVVCLYDNIA
ncbi:translational activator of cytochrome c oxidase 1 [Halyomorpha halys]|uniref:translational activator of cytochrome c oxidase 1 n=1 Tax=Halyomorpha halys TaxID=286706 RepID=UPI0006D4DADA|nr:translational activator of cytochrome c oxidase 1-like [Halyomorpha halys]